MAFPDWLAQHLVDTGHWDVHGVGRTARGRKCHKCKTFILAGLDADRCASSAYADPTPLSALGEAMALVAGRQTYALRRSANGFRLDVRDRWQIASQPAGPGRRFDVIADHVCNDPGPTGPLLAESIHSLSAKESDVRFAEIPF